VKLSNSSNVPISVTDLTTDLDTSSLPAGCNSDWFHIVQSDVSGNTVDVAANASVTLPHSGAKAPTIQLVDSHTNQDACQKAKVTLTYSGNASSGTATPTTPHHTTTPGVTRTTPTVTWGTPPSITYGTALSSHN